MAAFVCDMPCYRPLNGWKSINGGITFQKKDAYVDQLMSVSCGQCIGCKLERSRQWAIRCVHESQMHTDNCFITLTYDDDNIPFGGTLVLSDWQKFMKRLVKKNGPIRFYHCGEYGETTVRPHYHAILFGYRPNDAELFSTSGETKLYESPSLRKIWGLGHVTFGEATFDTAAYVARYVTKKVTGDAAKDHYEYFDTETGEIFTRKPEYSTMSRRPGIGLPWLDKFGNDAYSKDEVILRNTAMKPPRAYDVRYEQINPQHWKTIESIRKKTNSNYLQIKRDQSGNPITNNTNFSDTPSYSLKKPLPSQRLLKNGETIQLSKLQQRNLS